MVDAQTSACTILVTRQFHDTRHC